MERDASRNLAQSIVVALQHAQADSSLLDYGDVLEGITNLRVYGIRSIAFEYRGEEWSMSPGIMPTYSVNDFTP